MNKRPISLAKLRKVPSQFSWVDQRLVRERYIEQLSPEACALYLFLVTVADAQGLRGCLETKPLYDKRLCHIQGKAKNGLTG